MQAPVGSGAPFNCLKTEQKKARDMAERIGGHSAVALALTRQMVTRNAALPDPLEAHRIESLAIFYTSQIGGLEGVSAFQEKRAAKFDDRISRDMPDFYPWW